MSDPPSVTSGSVCGRAWAEGRVESGRRRFVVEATQEGEGARRAGQPVHPRVLPFHRNRSRVPDRVQFGALAYHYGNRRLVFLKAPALADVVETLSQFPSAADALAAHVPASQRDAYGKALSGLLTSDVIRAR